MASSCPGAARQQLQPGPEEPRAAVDFEHLSPEQLVEDILAKEQQITALLCEIREMLKERT